MRTGSFIVGLVQERTGVLGVSLLVSSSYYYCCPAKACPAWRRSRPRCLGSVTKYLDSLCRRYVRGPWGRIKGRLEDPSGLGTAWIGVVGCEFDSCDSWGFAGMGWMVVF